MTHQPGRWITAIACIVMSQHAFAQKVEVEEFTLANGMQFLLIPRTDQPHVVSRWMGRKSRQRQRATGHHRNQPLL